MPWFLILSSSMAPAQATGTSQYKPRINISECFLNFYHMVYFFFWKLIVTFSFYTIHNIKHGQSPHNPQTAVGWLISRRLRLTATWGTPSSNIAELELLRSIAYHNQTSSLAIHLQPWLTIRKCNYFRSAHADDALVRCTAAPRPCDRMFKTYNSADKVFKKLSIKIQENVQIIDQMKPFTKLKKLPDLMRPARLTFTLFLNTWLWELPHWHGHCTPYWITGRRADLLLVKNLKIAWLEIIEHSKSNSFLQAWIFLKYLLFIIVITNSLAW